MTKYEKIKLLIRDGDICDFINAEHGRMFGIYLGGELHYTQENGVVATLSGFESQITVIRRPYSMRTALTCFREEPVYNYNYKKYNDFTIIYDEDKEYDIQLELFFKGERDVFCKNKTEAYAFLKFLIIVGIVWKGDNPIVATGDIYATGIYYALENGKLVCSSWEEANKVVKFSDIPKELINRGRAIATEEVAFSNLTNCHAIKCSSGYESKELFKYLGKKGVWRSLVGPCSATNDLWGQLKGDVAYVIADKKFVDGNNVAILEKLGYTIIDFKDFIYAEKDFMEGFKRGTVDVICKTEQESLEFLKYLRLLGIVWKTGGPIVENLWEYNSKKGNKIVYSLQSGRLCHYHEGINKLSIAYSDIPKELLKVPLLGLMHVINLEDKINVNNITNHHAVRCTTNEESIALFEELGKKGICLGVTGGICVCSKDNHLWGYLGDDVSYVIGGNNCVYGNKTVVIKQLGYRIIDFKDFVLEGN